MIRKYSSLIISIFTVAIISGSFFMAHASAQSYTRVEMKSASTGMCLDVYRNRAVAGTPVGLFPCNKSDAAQKFAPQAGAIYFQNGLCVGQTAGRAVLLSCNNANLNFEYVNHNYSTMVFDFGNNLYATPPTSTVKGFNVLTVKPVSRLTMNQVFDIVRL